MACVCYISGTDQLACFFPLFISKKTILDKDQFDFLRDIVENVADPQGGSSSSGAGAAAEEGGSSSSNGSSKKDVKMEEARMAEADFSGAVAAARRKKA